jgi:hypothetical protein
MKVVLTYFVGLLLASLTPQFLNCELLQKDASGADHQAIITAEKLGNHFLFYKEFNGFVNELYIVQMDFPVHIEFGNINSISYSPDEKSTTVNSSAGIFFFKITANLNTHNEYQAYGLSKMTYTDQSLTKADLTGILSESGLSDNRKECDKQCIDGGCNALSCSREITIAGSGKSCSVSCGNNTHACCGDLALDGCWCRSNRCCNSTGPTH